jgi:hypothetical protein
VRFEERMQLGGRMSVWRGEPFLQERGYALFEVAEGRTAVAGYRHNNGEVGLQVIRISTNRWLGSQWMLLQRKYGRTFVKWSFRRVETARSNTSRDNLQCSSSEECAKLHTSLPSSSWAATWFCGWCARRPCCAALVQRRAWLTCGQYFAQERKDV